MKISKSILLGLLAILLAGSYQNASAQKTVSFGGISLDVPSEWEFNENVLTMGNGGGMRIHFKDFAPSADFESHGYAVSMWGDLFWEVLFEGPFE